LFSSQVIKKLINDVYYVKIIIEIKIIILDQRFNRPTLTVSKPYDETRPTLNIDTPGILREQKPTIHIYKWRPNYRVSRPGISIEHQLHDSWNSQIHSSTSLQIESKDSKQEYSGSDLISDFAQTVGELFDVV